MSGSDGGVGRIRRADAHRQQPWFNAGRTRTRPAIVLARFLRDVDVHADHPARISWPGSQTPITVITA